MALDKRRERLGWYLKRGRAMSFEELLARARLDVRARVDRQRTVSAAQPLDPAELDNGILPALASEELVRAILATFPGAAYAAREDSDRARELRFAFFGYPEVQLAQLDWHANPISGRSWPRRHWSTISYANGPGDPKWIWELGRCHHLLDLARGWRLASDERAASAACEHLTDFIDANPPGIGIHWGTGIEVALRLIQWTWAAALLRQHSGFRDVASKAMLPAIVEHVRHLERYPSPRSSWNNHRVAELVGLVCAGLAFPSLDGFEDSGWRAVDELSRVMPLQVHPDGTPSEQALGYGGFVLELALVAAACLKRAGEPLPRSVHDATSSLAEFLAKTCSDRGTLPAIGDDDDGRAIDLDPRLNKPERLMSRLLTAERLLGTRLSRVADRLDEQSAWLTGSVESPRKCERPGSALFASGGYAVLRPRHDTELRGLLRCGPFGHPSIHAHAHADLLSFCLSVDGEECLVDSGTFTYFGNPRWRDHGRSTYAHSTVVVDGRDQASPDGLFLWLRPPSAAPVSFGENEGRVYATGTHLAYAPVRHVRAVEMCGETIRVTDRLEGSGRCDSAELLWQLAPGTAERTADGVRWRGARATLEIAVSGVESLEVVEGRGQPPLGFRSRTLEHREPAPTLVATASGVLPIKINTVIVASTGVGS